MLFPIWAALDAQPKRNHHHDIGSALVQQHLNKSIQQMSEIDTHTQEWDWNCWYQPALLVQKQGLYKKTCFKDQPKVLSPLDDYQPHSD